jgi:uncharacterized protein (TIGR04255 family)
MSSKLALRYLNFFQNENFKDIINIQAKISDVDYKKTEDFNIGFISKVPDGKHRVNIATDAEYTFLKDTIKQKGQLIDIEGFNEFPLTSDKWMDILENLHSSIDVLFFSTLTDAYVKSLKVEY